MDELEQIQAYLQNNAKLLETLCTDSLIVEPLGKGEHNKNYTLTDAATNKRYVLRINVLPQPFHTNQVAYEFAALKALEPSGRAPVALYLDDTSQALGKGLLVESFCNGSELNFDDLKADDLGCVAHIMADVHATPVEVDSPLFKPADPLRALFKECVERFDVYRGTTFEEARYSNWIRRYLKGTQDAIDASWGVKDGNHIINTETLPSHFLLAHGAGGMTGSFVDWERPVIGEVAQDLAFFVAPTTTFWDSGYLFPKDDIASFIQTYWNAVEGRFDSKGFTQRFNAYLRVSILRSQTWFCKNAARYAQGSSAHTLQRTFDKWGTYVSDEFNAALFEDYFID